MENYIKVSLHEIPIYIIHYTKMIDRKVYLENWFKRYNLNPIWIIDGQREELTEEIIKKYYLYREDCNSGKKLNLGEIGCMLGHLGAMRLFSESTSKYALILEDDVYFPDNFIENFNNLFSRCPLDFDVISLGTCCGIVHPEATSSLNFHKITPARGRCGYAQLVSKKMCNIVLEQCIPFSWPPDWQIYNITSNNSTDPFVTYWIEPPIVSEGSKSDVYPSSIR